MRRHYQVWILSIALLLLFMSAVGWVIYFGYDQVLRSSWQKQSQEISTRLERSLSDTQIQLGVLAESLKVRIMPSQELSSAVLPADTLPLLQRLDVSEVILHSRQGSSKALYAVTPRTADTPLWRATLFDFWRTQAPQMALELTEYGPRVLCLEPVRVGSSLYALEVAINMDDFIAAFARRESVDIAFFAAESLLRDVNLPRVAGAGGTSYWLLATSAPQALPFIRQHSLASYLGDSSVGMVIRGSTATATLTITRLEYQSAIAPSAGASTAALLWTNYTPQLSRLYQERRVVLWLSWGAIIAVAIGVGYPTLRNRALLRHRLSVATDTLRHTNQMLQSEAAARQNAEEKLRRLAEEAFDVRQKDMELLASLSHQMKLSSTVVLGFCELLQDDAQHHSLGSLETVDSLRQTGESILHLAANLEHWARQQTQPPPPTLRLQELRPMVADALRSLISTAQRKQVTIQSSIPEGILVAADSHMIDLLVKNIVHNSIKFSRPQAQIFISARADDHGVELTVADAGSGISMSTMQHAFDITRTKLHRGTAGEEGLGLGLVVVKSILQIHQATIRITSDEGQGCRVAVLFPPAAIPPTTVPHISGAKLR